MTIRENIDYAEYNVCVILKGNIFRVPLIQVTVLPLSQYFLSTQYAVFYRLNTHSKMPFE